MSEQVPGDDPHNTGGPIEPFGAGLPAEPAEPMFQPVPHGERLQRLSQYISRKTLEGYTVVDKDEREVWVVLDKAAKPVNHVLHLLLTVFTCFIWLLIWGAMAAAQKKQSRIRASIDTYGNLLEERVNVR